MHDRFDSLDARVVAFLGRWSVSFLRVSLGIVFVWFGALKVFDVTPVADLVAAEGEFVVKNLVLLSAGMVVGSTVRRRPPISAPRPETRVRA